MLAILVVTRPTRPAAVWLRIRRALKARWTVPRGVTAPTRLQAAGTTFDALDTVTAAAP